MFVCLFLIHFFLTALEYHFLTVDVSLSFFPGETMKTKNENIDLRGLTFPPRLFWVGVAHYAFT